FGVKHRAQEVPDGPPYGNQRRRHGIRCRLAAWPLRYLGRALVGAGELDELGELDLSGGAGVDWIVCAVLVHPQALDGIPGVIRLRADADRRLDTRRCAGR